MFVSRTTARSVYNDRTGDLVSPILCENLSLWYIPHMWYLRGIPE
jgi:hypothetical protein